MNEQTRWITSKYQLHQLVNHSFLHQFISSTPSLTVANRCQSLPWQFRFRMRLGEVALGPGEATSGCRCRCCERILLAPPSFKLSDKLSEVAKFRCWKPWLSIRTWGASRIWAMPFRDFMGLKPVWRLRVSFAEAYWSSCAQSLGIQGCNMWQCCKWAFQTGIVGNLTDFQTLNGFEWFWGLKVCNRCWFGVSQAFGAGVSRFGNVPEASLQVFCLELCYQTLQIIDFIILYLIISRSFFKHSFISLDYFKLPKF